VSAAATKISDSLLALVWTSGCTIHRPTILFDGAVLNSVCFGHLTRRANQGHIGIIADIVEPAPETAGFYMSQDGPQDGFNLSKPFRRIPQSVGRSKTV
jgi:hypothetical protein